MLLNWIGLVLLTVVLGLIFSQNIKKRLKVIWYASKLPGPFCIPPLGCGHRFLCKREEIFSRIIDILVEYPQEIIRIWLGPKLLIVINKPEYVEKILYSNKMAQKDSMMDVMKPFIGNGMITGNGPSWRMHRKVISPMFNPKMIENFIRIFEKQSTVMVDKITQHIKNTKNPIVDIEEFMHPCTIDMVSETIMGLELNAQSYIEQDFLKAYEKMYHIVISRMTKPWLQYDFIYFFTPMYREQQKVVKILRSFILNSINSKQNDRRERIMDEVIKRLTNEGPKYSKNFKQKAKTLEEDDGSRGELKEVEYEEEDDGPNFKDILEQLVELMDGGEFQITEEELIDEMLTLFAASSDTIALISSFTLSMLAKHPELQDKAVEEIKTVKSKYGDNLNMAACGELQYIDRCIKEALRLFPIAPFMVRYAESDFQISETKTIPEGSTTFITNYMLHRNPQFWEKPQEFYPDHHLPEKVKERPACCYNPFSAGIRNCIGKVYATAAMKAIVVEFLSKYELEWKGPNVPVKDLPLYNDISVRLIGGHKILMKGRS